MSFCHNCGVSLPDDAAFCPKCGAPVIHLDRDADPVADPAEKPGTDQTSDPAPRFDLSTLPSGQISLRAFVWSIIDMILVCGMPFGIVGLVYTIWASHAPDAATEKRRVRGAYVANALFPALILLAIILYQIAKHFYPNI